MKKTYTKWWQVFSTAHNYKKLILWYGLFLLSPFLSAQNNNPDFRRVCAQGLGQNINLSWSPLVDNCGGFKKLYIYGRVDNLKPFQLIDSIANIAQTQYTHFGAKNISTTWSYFLVYKFLCSGDSAYSKTLEIDFDNPIVSDIDSVSVDINTGKIIMGWSQNPAPDLMGYFVWRIQGNNNIKIDTVSNTFYTDINSAANAGSQGYTITAIDSCLNQSTIQTGHKTMFLQHTYDTCANSITINWSQYIGWSNILNYTIYRKNGDKPFEVIQTNNPSELTYTYKNFIPGDTLEFYIRATNGNNGYTSASNKVTILTRARRYSTRNYISYATVLDSSSIEIKILGDTNSDTKKFTLYRKKNDEGFKKVTDIAYDRTSQSVVYTDNTVQPYLFSYQYRYISEDICGNLLDTSNIAKTIFLSLESDAVANKLFWNKYRLWNADVDKYNIYRGFDFGNGFTWNIINQTPNSDSAYNDINLPIDVGIAGTCYYVEAEERLGNIYGELSKSKSNVVCLVEDAVIHFPNAFAPDKVNTLFLPKGVNINYNRTSMLIYARNGQLMKKIDDIRQGWDGTNLNGDMCLEGVYLYLCELYSLNEKKYNFKGTVHLLR